MLSSLTCVDASKLLNTLLCCANTHRQGEVGVVLVLLRSALFTTVVHPVRHGRECGASEVLVCTEPRVVRELLGQIESERDEEIAFGTNAVALLDDGMSNRATFHTQVNGLIRPAYRSSHQVPHVFSLTTSLTSPRELSASCMYLLSASCAGSLWDVQPIKTHPALASLTSSRPTTHGVHPDDRAYP
eukprot:jgi/Chlat1/2560/Chrsp175S02437